MRELTEWFASTPLVDRPWLVLGKGPTFERRHEHDTSSFNTVGLNHVVNVVDVDVAHIIDIDVVGDCAERLEQGCRYLLMPRYPHVESTKGERLLEDWFDEHPVLARLSDADRLVWYNLSGDRPEGRSPVIGSKGFSSEAVLNILGRLGARTVRTLGVDGGRSYGSSFAHLTDRTLLANGAPSFDVQLERLAIIAEEHQIDLRPLVEPLRIFIGTDESQVVPHRVLEYSIRKHASIPVEVTPMIDVTTPVPRDRANKPGTRFTFARFAIPKLCGHQGRAVYLDADMLVLGDVAELAELAFDGASVLCTHQPAPPPAWRDHPGFHPGRHLAVIVLDCDRLDWDVAEIVAGLDEGRYTYDELMSDLCIVPPGEVAETVPVSWNHLERHEPGVTRLVHFTVVPTQPWKADGNPLHELWMSWYREAVEAGAVPPDEVEAGIRAGHLKPSLRAALRRAPARQAVLTNASLTLQEAQQRIEVLERRLAGMERSWAWRIGEAVVRPAREAKALARRLAR